MITGGRPDPTQRDMDRRKVWMFGISLLGEHGIEGDFDLGIESISITNDIEPLSEVSRSVRDLVYW